METELPLCFGAPPKAASTPNRPPLYAVYVNAPKRKRRLFPEIASDQIQEPKKYSMSHIETVSAFVEGAPPGEVKLRLIPVHPRVIANS